MTPFPSKYEFITCKMWADEPRPSEDFDLMEEQREILHAETDSLRQTRFGDYRAFLRRMETGDLLHEDDQKDVFPVSGGKGEVWETKPFGEDDLARLYHGEPSTSLQVVLLLCHMKAIKTTQQLTQSAQTEKIQAATDRYERGGRFQWGNRPIDAMRRSRTS